jgi:hypothetical protein
LIYFSNFIICVVSNRDFCVQNSVHVAALIVQIWPVQTSLWMQTVTKLVMMIDFENSSSVPHINGDGTDECYYVEDDVAMDCGDNAVSTWQLYTLYNHDGDEDDINKQLMMVR